MTRRRAEGSGARRRVDLGGLWAERRLPNGVRKRWRLQVGDRVVLWEGDAAVFATICEVVGQRVLVYADGLRRTFVARGNGDAWVVELAKEVDGYARLVSLFRRHRS